MEVIKNTSVSIADVEITRDFNGRYNLNALHRASGGDKKNGASYWLSLKSTQDLISELEKETTEITVVSVEGRNGGTFAHELLAISYAGWISPAFQLKVNQAFIDSKKPKEFQLPTNFIEALEALVISEKEKLVITHERDEAIRTKAMIGSKREASAMAKASAEARRAKSLEIKLDQSNEYATVKRMEIAYKRKFSWRVLKKASIEMKKPMMKAQDENYGEVNSYHADVWKEIYNLEIK